MGVDHVLEAFRGILELGQDRELEVILENLLVVLEGFGVPLIRPVQPFETWLVVIGFCTQNQGLDRNQDLWTNKDKKYS